MMSNIQHESSTHKAEVVDVVLEKHPNADSLSVAKVFGYTVCVRTADWDGVKTGVYITPDSSVDVSRPEFSFLADQAKSDGKARIKAKKLRGIVSFGLLIKAPDDAVLGQDLAAQLGVEHYEPPSEQDRRGLFLGGEVASPPKVYFCKYDVDAFRRYHRLFVDGEPVFVTEKIDGCNARYVWHDGAMHCGSRTEWKKEFPNYDHVTVESLTPKIGEERAKEVVDKLHSKPKPKNLWWSVLEQTPSLEKFCRDHPGIVVYGECYGHVQKLRYGHGPGKVSFSAFDLLDGTTWLDAKAARDVGLDLPWVPTLADGLPYSFDAIVAMAEGQSTVPGAQHIREGCVVKPLIERQDAHIGRVCFKAVGGEYLEKFR